MTADDDDLDDASLKSMRAVWLAMRDEEPPAAGMSALLAAAASKAEQMREQAQPWWQRAFGVLRRPPVLAFATVMVLIGGAVLVTRTSDDKTASEVARPALEARDVPIGGAAPGPTPPPGQPVEEAVEPVHDLPATAAPEAPQAPPRPVVKVPGGERRRKVARPSSNPAEPDRYHRFEDDVKESAAQHGPSGRDISGTTLSAPEQVKASGGGMREVSEPVEDPVDAAPTPMKDSERAPRTGTPKQAPSLEQLARQAESAAVRGDCAAVKAIVARLEASDPAFFKARLGKSAAVTKCL